MIFDSLKWLTGVFSFYLCNGIIFIYVKWKKICLSFKNVYLKQYNKYNKTNKLPIICTALECGLICHQCDQPFEKWKKVHVTSLPVVQQQTHIRPISWSKPISDSEGRTALPSDWPWSRYSCTCVYVWKCVCYCSQTGRERWVVETRAVLPT